MEENTHKITSIRGMFQDWFLDYASYVILERAVPHINDGLKPLRYGMQTQESALKPWMDIQVGSIP